MTPSNELTLKFLAKAEQDRYAMRKLIPDADASDEVIGFHAQQAVEKMLKAVLCFHEIHFEKTHNLTTLFDLLNDNGLNFPDELEDARLLTPYAVEFRYDFHDDLDKPLDRGWVADCVNRVRDWVDRAIPELPSG